MRKLFLRNQFLMFGFPSYPSGFQVPKFVQVQGFDPSNLTTRKSHWTFISKTGSSINMDEVVKAFQSWLSDLGAGNALTINVGPLLSSQKLKNFYNRWLIEQEISSPHNTN